MTENSHKEKAESVVKAIFHESESLMNYSRRELKEMAKNLSDGKYQNNSQQRDKILQLLVEQLSTLDTSK